jgi:transcriptional regulator with XRE-family HTH domain
MERVLICTTGQDIRDLRDRMGMKQSDFWKRILVTQSGGSRYETGRTIPKQVLLLIHLAYAETKGAERLLKELRNGKSVETLRNIQIKPRIRRPSQPASLHMGAA